MHSRQGKSDSEMEIPAVLEERDKLWQGSGAIWEPSKVVREKLPLFSVLHCSHQTLGLLRASQRLNLSLPRSLPSQNVTSQTGVSIPVLRISQSITPCGPEGKANLQYFQACMSKCLSAYRNAMPYKLIVSSLASSALIWHKSTNFNNQIMEAQHKKLRLFWSQHDPPCIKLWQGASLPLSVTFLGKKGG